MTHQRRSARLTLLVLLVACIAAIAADQARSARGVAQAARAQLPAVSHFKCYRPSTTLRPQTTPRVTLRDRFDQKPEKVSVVALYRFCNPVTKTYRDRTTKAVNPALHLALYTIRTKPTTGHRIVVRNQLTKEQALSIGPPKWMAVPTSVRAKIPPNPKLLSHFKCYPVTTKVVLPRVIVDLTDSYFKHVEKGVVVGAARIFCNPALKVHAGHRYPVVNATTRLVCYQIALSKFRHGTPIFNQFNRRKLTVTGADLLCVPSLLLKHSP
jgi:hypothetical protein